MQHIALLRGINLGKKQVKMEILRTMLEDMGFSNVKTLLASGNVVFESNNDDSVSLQKAISTQFSATFGFDSHVIMRTMAQIQKILEDDPFSKIKVDKNTRLYVTFLSEPHHSSLKIPYQSNDGSLSIIKTTATEVFCVVQLLPSKGTLDAMELLTKEYGKEITTRNWNTVQKIAAEHR